MKKKEPKKMNSDQSIREIHKLKKDLFNMRFKKMNGPVEDTSKFSTTKKNIAKILTILNNKKDKWLKKN